MKVSHELTGKFQTDNLESRFGSYRSLSGTNYHISVQEVKESNKKLKILKMPYVVSKFNVSALMMPMSSIVTSETLIVGA